MQICRPLYWCDLEKEDKAGSAMFYKRSYFVESKKRRQVNETFLN